MLKYYIRASWLEYYIVTTMLKYYNYTYQLIEVFYSTTWHRCMRSIQPNEGVAHSNLPEKKRYQKSFQMFARIFLRFYPKLRRGEGTRPRCLLLDLVCLYHMTKIIYIPLGGRTSLFGTRYSKMIYLRAADQRGNAFWIDSDLGSS